MLAARVGEAVVGGEGLVIAGEVARAVGHAPGDDPVEVLDASFAVGRDQRRRGLLHAERLGRRFLVEDGEGDARDADQLVSFIGNFYFP